MNEDILGIKINKDLQWFKMTLANGEEIDFVKKQDYIKLQNNWNELKKWCKENQYIGKTITFENDVTYTEILYKMQELEKKR